MNINLISFVKLLSEYQKVQLIYENRMNALTPKLLAEHAMDIVREVSIMGSDTLNVTVSKDIGPYDRITSCI